MKPRILVSISGGRTSAMMAVMIKKLFGKTHDIIFVFANTSREKEATLKFLHWVDTHFDLGVIWVEALVHLGQRKSTTHKVVNYETAARDGSVFEDVIRKYGIPNVEFKHCTRELKTNPIKSYAKSLGWIYGKNYQTAIGYRADEQKRIKIKKVEKERHLYILNDAGIRKADVNKFWSLQPYDLEIPDYDGNCELCFKKAKRKLLTQLVEGASPEWHKRMEKKYEHVRPEKRRFEQGLPPVRFFRDNDSIDDLVEESKLPFDKAIDQSKNTDGYTQAAFFNADMDYEDSDCGSSCEPFS